MPAREIYRVSFKNGNKNPWPGSIFGPMVVGGQGGPANLIRMSDDYGLTLRIVRPDATSPPIANSLWVLPGRDVLPLATRLKLGVWFDRPEATAASPDVKAEAWAVAVGLKLSDLPEDVITTDPSDSEPAIHVTCQFNRGTNDRNGVRLNTPRAVHDATSDKAKDLDTPLDYGRYRPGCLQFFGRCPAFVMEHWFCGVQAGPRPGRQHDQGEDLGHSAGFGSLDIDGRKDQRVFSSERFSGGQQTWIGALGVSVATFSGVGTAEARIRSFWISRWD